MITAECRYQTLHLTAAASRNLEFRVSPAAVAGELVRYGSSYQTPSRERFRRQHPNNHTRPASHKKSDFHKKSGVCTKSPDPMRHASSVIQTDQASKTIVSAILIPNGTAKLGMANPKQRLSKKSGT